MDSSKLTKLDNYKNTVSVKNKRLHKTLDTLGELLGIEFGSITVKFHDGKWNPKIQIEKKLVQDVIE